MAFRIKQWREAAASMHPAGWLWAFMHKNPTPKRFDLLYKLGNGDPWRTENAPYEDRKRADLLSMLRPAYKQILDVGCGTGSITNLLAAYGPVLGLDASTEAIKRAHLRAAPNVKFEVADLRTCPLTPGYDLIVASEVLYYLPDPIRPEVIHRLVENLTPGGHFISAGGKGDDRVNPLIAGARGMKPAGEIVRDADVWRPYRIALFEKAG